MTTTKNRYNAALHAGASFAEYQANRADWLRGEIAECHDRADALNADALEKVIAAETLESRAAELRRAAGGIATKAAQYRAVAAEHAAELSVRAIADAHPYCAMHDIYSCPYAH